MKRLLAFLVLLVLQVQAADAHPHLLKFQGYSWHVHEGRGHLGQRWARSHVTVHNGILTILTKDGVGGGVAMAMNRTFGIYRVRYRMSAGVGTKYAILLWPGSGTRPEIDFAEGSKHDAARHTLMATYHPAPGCTRCSQFRRTGDYTKWHTAGVIWKPTGFTFILDGRKWASIRVHTAKPSHLSIQTAQFAHGPPTRLQVSNVSIH